MCARSCVCLYMCIVRGAGQLSFSSLQFPSCAGNSHYILGSSYTLIPPVPPDIFLKCTAILRPRSFSRRAYVDEVRFDYDGFG